MSNTFITEDEFENKKMQVIEKLEKMLSLEENVAELTYKGIQRFVSSISQAFGKTFHKGVWLHREESKLVADISIAVKPNVDVYQTALHIQEKVKTIVLQNMHVSVCDVNVIITGITE